MMSEHSINVPEINRRRLLGGIAAASTASAVAGSSVAIAATYETPMQRMERARAELVEATKAAFPEVTDWRICRAEDDEGKTVGFFMVIGHLPKGVRS